RVWFSSSQARQVVRSITWSRSSSCPVNTLPPAAFVAELLPEARVFAAARALDFLEPPPEVLRLLGAWPEEPPPALPIPADRARPPAPDPSTVLAATPRPPARVARAGPRPAPAARGSARRPAAPRAPDAR